MSTVSLWTVAFSLTFHGVMLVVAAREPEMPPRRSRISVVAPLEGAISVDTAAIGAPPPDSTPALAGPEHPLMRAGLQVRKTPAPIAALVQRPTSRSPAPSPEPQPRPSRLPPAVASATAMSSLAPSPMPPVTPSPAATLPAPPTAEGGAFAGLPAAAAARPAASAEAQETESLSPGGKTAAQARVGATGAGGAGGRGMTERATGDGHAQVLARYLKGVRDRVSRHREYPYLARRANLEGTVCLRVVVAASGRVVGATPTCGGSHQPLVEAALASVSSAAPFPPLPATLGQQLTIDVPVVFALDRL